MWMVFWTFLTPPPPMWIILLNKSYVLMWIFREPPLPPWSSTWFMDVPFYGCCDLTEKVYLKYILYIFHDFFFAKQVVFHYV